MQRAHCTPKTISSGAAIGGPMIVAKLTVDWKTLVALILSAGATTVLSIAIRAGEKNCAKQLAAVTTA